CFPRMGGPQIGCTSCREKHKRIRPSERCSRPQDQELRARVRAKGPRFLFPERQFARLSFPPGAEEPPLGPSPPLSHGRRKSRVPSHHLWFARRYSQGSRKRLSEKQRGVSHESKVSEPMTFASREM